MLFVAGENLVPILVALLIGFVAGLWIWKFSRRRADDAPPVLTEQPMRRPYMDARLAEPPLDLGPSASDDHDLPAVPRPEPEVLARRARAPISSMAVDDDDIVSGPAAAIEDVAGEFLGVDAHPGPVDAAGAAAGGGDDLQVMKGVGPKLASLLRGEGIMRFEQIAALTPGDLARLDAHLGAFKGRLARDRIVEQAAFLAAGDRAGYERAFGRL